jgi:flavin-dependent dehydrogenase
MSRTRLGFLTKPKRRQYDVSIYGAGPAGLSAAVYAASEGCLDCGPLDHYRSDGRRVAEEGESGDAGRRRHGVEWAEWTIEITKVATITRSVLTGTHRCGNSPT